MISSPTQIEDYQACPTLWHFSHDRGLKPESGPSAIKGTTGHEHLARYFRTGELPPKRASMAKTVTHAILAGGAYLPKPSADLLIEDRFDGQEQRDAEGKWILCDESQTLRVAGFPIDGFVDLGYSLGDVAVVIDHKFSGDPKQRAEELGNPLNSAAMPLYALHARRYWPQTRLFKLQYHMVGFTAGQSFMSPHNYTASVDQILQRESEIAISLRSMSALVGAQSADQIPFNRRRCNVGMGCPHQSICPHFRSNRVNMTNEEAALFNDIPEDAPEAPPAEEVDELAAMEAKIAAMKAAKARTQAAPPPPQPAPAADVPPPPAKRGPGRPPKDPNAPPKPPKKQYVVDVCACDTPLTPENSSTLQDGRTKHIGCPLDTPAPAPAPKPTQKAATASKLFAEALRSFAKAIEALE